MPDTETPTAGEPKSITPETATPSPRVLIPGGKGGTAMMRMGDLTHRQKASHGPAFLDAFLPNRVISPGAMRVIALVELAIFVLFWIKSPFKVLPRPGEVMIALRHLWMHQGLGQDLATSFKLNLEALGWSSLLSLGLAYLTVIPIFRPLVAAMTKGRFLSLVGFTFIFTLIWGGGHELKTSLLVFAVTVFYLTSMASVIAVIPKGDFDHARTLRMREWRVVWEVVVLGTADRAFEVLRQNAAMGWMMLTMVEGIVRSEGGIGTSLLAESKHFLLPEVFAIQVVILVVGMAQDYVIGLVRGIICPYADMALERR